LKIYTFVIKIVEVLSVYVKMLRFLLHR